MDAGEKKEIQREDMDRCAMQRAERKSVDTNKREFRAFTECRGVSNGSGSLSERLHLSYLEEESNSSLARSLETRLLFPTANSESVPRNLLRLQAREKGLHDASWLSGPGLAHLGQQWNPVNFNQSKH